MYFNRTLAQFDTLNELPDGLSTLEIPNPPCKVCSLPFVLYAVGMSALYRSLQVNEVALLLCCTVLIRLSNIKYNNSPYSLRKNFLWHDMFPLPARCLLLVSGMLPDLVTKFLSVYCPRASQLEAIKLEEDRNVVIRIVSYLVSTFCINIGH